MRPPLDAKTRGVKSAHHHSGLASLVQETRNPLAEPSIGRDNSLSGAASRSTGSDDESESPSIQEVAVKAPTASEMKLSSERLEILVAKLRDAKDEQEAGTIILECALRVKNHEIVASGAFFPLGFRGREGGRTALYYLSHEAIQQQ